MKSRAMKFVSAAPVALASLATFAMASITLVDVVMRNLSLGAVPGSYEIARVCLCVAIFASLAEATRRKAHITIDVIDTMVPGHLVRWFKRLASLALAVFVLLLFKAGWHQARDAFEYGDLTPDLRWPLIVFWGPILTGLAATALVAVLQIFRRSK
ncbi:TRAP transporter small permease [Rhodobacteraceae bacterium F11138]|nr:TRAP transporter small permease [Rhodobacteraceae bacterium F11138]